MKLDYGTQISPASIMLSIGTVKKPTLKEISEITFGKFYFYAALMTSTPRDYYTIILKNMGTIWSSMTENERDNATMYSMILADKELRILYEDMLNFYFEEDVHYIDGLFLVLKKDTTFDENIDSSAICGVIQEGNFNEVLSVFRQICCIESEESEEKPKFKNKKAREIYEKIHKGQSQKAATKKKDINLSIPNIISAVASKHPSLNLTNIWNLTLFQLLDSFNRLQSNAVYDIDSMRVSTWGDEKKTFDLALWYKNYYDTNDQSR